MNIININKLMHENTKFKVSPGAVKELSGRIVDKPYDLAPEFDKEAKKDGRKAIQEQDVIRALSFIDNEVV